MDFLVENAQQSAEAIKKDDQLGERTEPAKIVVAGVGGGGNNAVNWLYKKGIKGAQILGFNTDQQHLDFINVDRKILMGRELTKGLGCGGYPNVGEEAAKESMHQLREIFKEADMVFVCAGLGGGTGTGAAPVIARVAKEAGAIVIGTVTMPFKIEKARIDRAEVGLQELRQVSDTVIVVDNNKLVQIAGNLPIQKAFEVANELLSTMIQGIVETIAVPSLVNLDYADVKSIMTNGGVAVIGYGSSNTTNRVQEAVAQALNNPLLDVSYEGATGALIHISGGPDMTLDEINTIGELVTEKLDADSLVIWGARVDESLEGRLSVMTIVTGVDSPWIVGKPQNTLQQPLQTRVDTDLGIEIVS